MKTIALLALCLALPSCAVTKGTILYNPSTGGKLAEFHVDMDMMTYTGGGVSCTITNHRVSRTIAARGRAYTEFVKAAGGQAKAFGGGIP